MKKILTIAASLAMVAGLASCQKENIIDNGGNGDNIKTGTITATFAKPTTKVTYSEVENGSDWDLQPHWEVDDIIVGINSYNEAFELTVINVVGEVATLDVSADDKTKCDGSVTLFYKTGLRAEDWGCTIGDGNTWRTLSNDEWEYLFENRSAMSGVTIGDTHYTGVIIYPDNYNGDEVSSSMTWDQINAAGIVYLPAAGYRNGSNPTEVDEWGHYWSSTADGESSAYHVKFESGDDVNPDMFDRSKGCSVRLITECQ